MVLRICYRVYSTCIADGVQCVVCTEEEVVCSIEYTVDSVQYVVYSMQATLYSGQYIVCSIHEYSLYSILYRVHRRVQSRPCIAHSDVYYVNAIGSTQYAAFAVQQVVCITLRIVCSDWCIAYSLQYIADVSSMQCMISGIRYSTLPICYSRVAIFYSRFTTCQ